MILSLGRKVGTAQAAAAVQSVLIASDESVGEESSRGSDFCIAHSNGTGAVARVQACAYFRIPMMLQFPQDQLRGRVAGVGNFGCCTAGQEADVPELQRLRDACLPGGER